MKYDKNQALLHSSIPGLPEPHRGKVRDVYDLGDQLLFVASDRISAFDCVMPNGIPDKGKVLTQMSLFWFEYFADELSNHLISADVADFPDAAQTVAEDLRGRSMLVRKANVFPVECVARGYLIGTGWKDYQKSGSVCGIDLRPGYKQAEKLDRPIFTPAFKAEFGEHDENIDYPKVIELTDADVAETLRRLTLDVYGKAADYAAQRGIIIADTKFEFGRDKDGTVLLADEVLTPDSSRCWPADEYATGSNPPSLDKQYVRDWLENVNFNKQPPAPELPNEVVEGTRKRYLDALRAVADKDLDHT